MKQITLVLRHGKTVKIDITLSEECRVQTVIVSGDFFVYPEETLEQLEKSLIGCASRECIEVAFKVLEESITLGLDKKDLKNKLVKIIEECRELNQKHGE